ncbi:protease inhibitor [Actinomadura sp. NAK00032]|uniref:SSI family serine proteinase inhibitor n=1 Tax=Actinomadura sp. NAK00032 TaxID=2742128 RepID=UPI0015923237|nr:SSI family serine proteinase inhibitor [Actinomadura sp. NAK00032]QKW35389.1 protease inhibitor [Actinomadura sp. NAK00032]
MRGVFRLILGAGLVAGGMAAAPAASAADGAPPAPLTVITLQVASQLGSGPLRTATLECDPVGGTHSNAKTACAELAAANGDVRQVPWRSGWACPDIWKPVVATATGYWQGVPIKPYSETFTNDGCARIGHGHVLDF